MRILIVDDDISSVIALTNLLKFENSLKVASNGSDALDSYRSAEYDVVISDIRMPRMNGIELLKEIKACNSDAKVIIVTGYPDQKDEFEARKNGAYAFMLKPLDVNNFMETLQKIKNDNNNRNIVKRV